MSEHRAHAPLEESARFKPQVPRRDFLGLAALLVVHRHRRGDGRPGLLRLPMPSVFPETGSKFRIGPPDRYPPGSVVTIAERNVLVLRDAAGLPRAQPGLHAPGLHRRRARIRRLRLSLPRLALRRRRAR